MLSENLINLRNKKTNRTTNRSSANKPSVKKYSPASGFEPVLLESQSDTLPLGHVVSVLPPNMIEKRG